MRENAFSNYANLKKITIPKSVRTISNNTFSQNKNLKTVEFEDGIELNNLYNSTFADCESLESISIPKSVKILGSNLFQNCFSLERVIFENGSALSKIEYGAFLNCTSLKEIILPDSLTEIEGGDEYYQRGAFENCKSLEALIIPLKVKIIEYNAFSGCDSLKTISVNPDNNTYKSDQNCLIMSYNNVVNPSHILILGAGDSVIPDYITNIADYAFEGRIYLENIPLPINIKTIGLAAFRNCYNLL